MKKSAIITQSNYIPWKGYFDSINQGDVFVVYDDMQYTKRDWRNRNLIKTPKGLEWLSIPVEVKGKYFQKIKDTKIADLNWTKSHLEKIKQNYKQSNNYKELLPWLENIYLSCNFEFLTDVNLHFINHINAYLGIKTEIKLSSEFILHEDRNQRLLNICKDLGVTEYYSGPAAKAYMNEELFNNENIKVNYFNYSGYVEYNQLFPPFEHGVSIIDVLINEGENSIKFLKRNEI